MTRWFNIAGPCFSDEHYMIPPERRVGPMLTMIAEGRWFTLVSGWQTGKTTVLGWLRAHLDATGSYTALQVDLETAREKPDTATTMRVILDVLDETIERARPDLTRPGRDALRERLEVPDRALTWLKQLSLKQETAWYVRSDGSLDLAKLMGAWQEFWREDGHLALDGFGYQESGPHLMLMAFLQRVVNGGGRIEREYALGRGALDLVIVWKTWRYAIEVKVRHTSTTEARGVKQLAGYLATMGLTEGWLVIFDMRMSVPWDERVYAHDVEHEGKTIHVLGC